MEIHKDQLFNNRYRIIDGSKKEGGMAIVYQALDTRTSQHVAIKILKKSEFAPKDLEEVLNRFEQEAKSLAQLTHINIVTLIDFGEYDQMPFLVMPFLSGGTLKEHLGKKMPYQQAARLLAPIARALDYAHSKGMIHRDVKPSNILLTETGDPMLSDFGVVKLLEQDRHLTGTRVGIGTPEYMALEQSLGNPVPASDQYSLGVVFYQLLTGQVPYKAESTTELALKQNNEEPEDPRKFVKDLPPQVIKFINRTLDKDPNRRFPSMKELARELQELSYLNANTEVTLSDFDNTSTTTMPIFNLPKASDAGGLKVADDSLLETNKPRTGLYVAIGAGLLALLVCGISAVFLFSTLQKSLDPQPTSTVILGTKISATNTSSPPVITQEPATDQKPAVKVIPTETLAPEPTATIPPAIPDPVVIDSASVKALAVQLSFQASRSSPVKAVVISPDRQWLAAGTQSGSVDVWNLVTQEQILKSEHPDSEVTHLVFSPDSSNIVAAYNNSTIDAWSTTNDLNPRHQTLLAPVVGMIFKDEDTLLLFLNNARIFSWNLKRNTLKQERELFDATGLVITQATFTPDQQTVFLSMRTKGLLTSAVVPCPSGYTTQGYTYYETEQIMRRKDIGKEGWRDISDEVYYGKDRPFYNTAALSPDGTLVAFAMLENQQLQLTIWDANLKAPKYHAIIRQPFSGINKPEKVSMECVSSDQKTTKTVDSWHPMFMDVYSLVFTSNPDDLLVAAPIEGQVSFVQVTSGEVLFQLEAPSQPTTVFNISQDGKMFVVGLANGQVQVWWKE